MEMQVESNIVYAGQYLDRLVYTPSPYLAVCAVVQEALAAARAVDSWDELLGLFERSFLRDALDGVLSLHWVTNTGAMAGDLPDDYYPPLPELFVGNWYEFLPLPNDAQWLSDSLPAEVMKYARRPETELVSGLDTVFWELDDRPTVDRLVEESGLLLEDGTELFGHLEQLWRAMRPMG